MSNLQIEKLAGRENYSTWKFAVKSYLQHEDLWECVDPGTEVDFKKDVKAKSKIILLVEPINYVHIENAQSSREVWTNLQNAFEDSGLSRKVGLLRDLINTTLDNCATVEEYVNKIMSTAYKLRNIGFQVDDEWLGTLMLAGLPDNYKPMIMGLESSGIKISSDFVKTKLLQEVKVSESSALFTKHKNTSKTNAKQKGKGPRCYNCNKYGHFKNQCQEKKSNQNSFSAVFSAYSNVDKDEWYIDSGATMHMTRRSDWMYDMQASPIHQIKVANDDVVSVQNMGKVNIKTIFCKDECPIQVRNVLYIPELSVNLLSVSQLTKNGCKVEFTDTGCNIFNANKILIANARLLNNMYKLNTASVNAYAVACESKTDIMTWHKRMGHLNLADVKRLESCAEGITITNKDVDTVCIPCCEAKQTRLPFPHSGSRAKALLEIVHTDLCGPMETPSAGGAKYFITFIDDYSRKVYVYFLKNKMDIKSVFQKFKEEVENELERKIKIVRSDNGKEYCNNEFSVFLAASGIKHQTSTPYTPEHNGLAERMNRSLVERAKSMLFEAKLQKQLWAEAVTTAAYVINRSPSRVLAEVTPYEKWTGKKPNLSNLKIFGSTAMVHIPKQNRLKWDRKSRELIFVGYCDNTKGYRLYDPVNKKVVVSRDVIFIEKTFHSDNQTQQPVLTKELVNIPISQNDEVISVDNTLESETYDDASSHSSTDTSRMTDDETYYPSSNDDSSVDSISRNITLRSHQRHNNFMCVQQISDPLTVEEALSGSDAEHWKAAMDEEYQSLLENNTWDITTLPDNKRPIPCKWVFKRKTNENGEVIKFKARLVIKGCSQRPGVDYTEVFSPVIRYASLRYLFALAVKFDLDICQMDAVSAFLQGDIEEEIYMMQPPMYENGKQVCRLKKSLYGLKQASRQWNKKLSSTLKRIGLSQNKLDPCLYYKIVDSNNMIFLATYVDDIIIFTNNMESKNQIKEELRKQFKIKDLGDINYCIGIHVERDREKGVIYLDQKKYIREVLNKYGMSDCKSVKIPMDVNTKLKSISEETDTLKGIPYQEIIGCLLYISQITRPDISFVINLLSKYNQKPEMSHWLALKRVMRYLKGTEEYRLSYKQNSEENMTHGYCDADWASSEDDRRSCTGYIFLFQGGAISWNSKRQPTVALSTTEAEYMSLSSCVQEAMWLKQLQETFWPLLKNEAMIVYSDNQSSIKLSESDGYHSRTKHIDVRHHYVRDKVVEGAIDVQYIQTDLMTADALTKATPHAKLAYCTSKMGLI